MAKFIVFIYFLLICQFAGIAQAKTLQAIRVDEAPRIDGILDEPIWQSAPYATDFITRSPVFGRPGNDRTEVRVLYDNIAIYVGVHLYADPSMIRRQLTPRDQERDADVDYFAVFIDSYKDRQNAYQFVVTSRNVQSDARVSPNITPASGVYGDLSWDAVWDSRVSMAADGWVVEMKIPLFSIRFAKQKGPLEWGIQFLRFNRSLSETSFWNAVDPNISGFVNQFGDLSGIYDLLPPLRLSFSPYVSGGYRSTPSMMQGYQNEALKSGGMDVKYGLSESFTLDATLIPDFGQVISDNVINNISPFEIQFLENRQFFTEGTELFNKADIFYSRRIGKEPERYKYIRDSTGTGALADYDVVRNPSVTRLVNALKFSGRTRNNLGIGVFNAVGRSEKAILRNKYSGKDSAITTEELANYNVFVLDQAFKNRSYITLTNTNVIRNGNRRDANVTGLDMVFYDKRNRYGLALVPRYSKIFNAAGGYDGFKNYAFLGKVSGKFQYSLSNELVTAMYDPNDLGFLESPNELVNTGEASYNIYDPNRWLLNQQYSVKILQAYLYKPFEYQKTEVSATSNWTFKNFWTLQLQAGTTPFWFNDFYELQTPSDRFITPRQKLKRSPFYFFFADGSTDNRKPVFFSWSLGFSEGELPDNPFYKVGLESRLRFSEKFSLNLSYNRQHDNGMFGYSFLRDPLTDEPILARRKYTDVTSIVSGIYNFTPRMNISFRARHFWNRILNTNLYNVKSDGYWDERMDIDPSSQNVNYNVFNLDLFYTWDFRLGSRIIFAWKNNLGSEYESRLYGRNYRKYLSNVGQVMRAPHGNEVTIRFIYFINYQDFK
ncbi:MAG TPA: DUF5916 domain-containing protein [Flavitalea sp.]|nr:DUF5916 domain-containing protein [Flavitalea sp.]